MKQELLLELADFLSGEGDYAGQGIPKEKFNLSFWMVDSRFFSAFDQEDYDVPTGSELPQYGKTRIQGTRAFNECGERKRGSFSLIGIEPAECQTVGCAMGWASTIPKFKDLGLCLYCEREIGSVSGGGALTAGLYYKEKIGFEAAAEFFEIPMHIADALFSSKRYYGSEKSGLWDPKVVAARIRRAARGQIIILDEDKHG